jgi:hypothetical protein
MKKLSLLLAVFAIAGLVTLAGAESRIEKNLKLEPNGRFLLESDGGSVTLTGVASSGAKFVITSERSDLESLYTITLQENAGSAGVTVRRKDRGSFGIFNWGHGYSLHFDVQVPSQTQTDIRTGGGGVEVSNLRGDSRLRTSGGSIGVSALTGRLDASTSGGPIRLREITGDTRIDTSGGPIVLESLEGSLDAHTKRARRLARNLRRTHQRGRGTHRQPRDRRLDFRRFRGLRPAYSKAGQGFEFQLARHSRFRRIDAAPAHHWRLHPYRSALVGRMST